MDYPRGEGYSMPVDVDGTQYFSTDDVADAAAIAVCHLRHCRMKKMVVLARVGGRRA